MVWFTFTFLLGIPNVSSGVDEKSKKPIEKLQVSQNYTEMEVSKPVFSCHIEYVLFPADEPKQIDVVCWDQVAKIYYENASSAIQPLVVDDLRWIHFRVNHKVKLSTSDIPLLHGHLVRVVVSLGNKKLGDPAKTDNVKKFYCAKFTDNENNSIRKQFFQPVSETLDDLESVSFFKEHLTPQQQLYIELDTTMETSENYNRLVEVMLKLSNEYQDVGNPRTPLYPTKEFPPLKNLFRSNIEPEKASAIDKKDKTPAEKKKDVNSDCLEFIFPGENFFSGRKTFENLAKYTSTDLPYLMSLIKVRNVMTRAQAEHFNPLSIVLKHCRYLPAEDLKTHGVTLLKFQYVICNEFLAESNLIPIDDSIELDFARTILTDQIDKTQLIHFLQTGGLRIKVFGDLDPEKTIRGERVYGGTGTGSGEDGAREVSNRLRHRTTSFAAPDGFFLLGACFADISSVLLQPYRTLIKCDLKIPPEEMPFRGHENLNDVVTVYDYYSRTTEKLDLALPRSSLCSSPVLTISLRMGHPLTKVYRTVSMNPDLFNRLFAVICDKDLAISIIQIIENDTREILEPVNYCRNGLNVQRPLTKHHKGWVHDRTQLATQMTGFYISSMNKVVVFVEGPIYGNIQQIWAILSYLKPSQGRVLYDSSLIFTERLYTNFFKYGGFLKGNLPIDLEIIWTKPRKCGQLSMPELAWKALIALNMLIHSKSIKAVIQNNLLPDSQSLNCLALELGVPVQMCHRLS